MLPKWLNPSVANLSLTLRGSDAKSKCCLSNVFQATLWVECLSVPSSIQTLACYHMCSGGTDDINNLCNLKGNHRNTFSSLLFALVDDSTAPPVTCFNFDMPHAVQVSKSSQCFQNNIQPLWPATIFSYPSPKSLVYFFASYATLGNDFPSGTTLQKIQSMQFDLKFRCIFKEKI
jgi:hypothetical protein